MFQFNVNYGCGEERANYITHGVGLLLSIVGLCFLILHGTDTASTWNMVCCIVYGSTLILLYGSSTLYHFVKVGKLKFVLKRIDHLSIYLLIAGTYTPFTLINLRNSWGWHIFFTVWGFALAGFILKIFFFGKYPKISVLLYLVMGWIILIAIEPLFMNISIGGFVWLVVGGLTYSFGVFFFIFDEKPYYHAVWHGFVVCGSVCHYLAILMYVLPYVQ
ncbi:MAG: hemolysin III [Planctomycetota bacterium]|nr:MAG: hemolysin III [Planctomycetota bacterium]